VIRILFGAVASLASAGILAATVEISVVEQGGEPVTGQMVVLTPATRDNSFMRPAGWCTTSASGRCEIKDVRPGVYVPDIRIADPNFAANADPEDTYGTVTILKPDAKATLRIELQRGVRVQFHAVGATPTAVTLTDDSGRRASAAFDKAGIAKLTLASGHWVAHLEGQPAALIAAAELDGVPLDTLDVPLELVAPSSDRFVTWTVIRPCGVYGYVTSTRTIPGVTVGARLVKAGSWGKLRRCRDADCAGAPPSATVGPETGFYIFGVPSGTWRVAPVGDSLLESSPPFVDVICEDEGEAKASFSVRETEPEEKENAMLVVMVVNPDDLPVAGVPVELWPESGNLGAKAPIATEPTVGWGAAFFRKLAPGSYLIRVRRPGYRTAVLALPDLGPAGRVPRRVRVQLDKGATIDAVAKDAEGRPVTGVGLEVTWIDDSQGGAEPITSLAAPEAVISVPPGLDQGGHVTLTGLAGGTYRVKPVLSGAVASAGVISVASGEGAGQKDVELHLGEHETKELSLRVLPAPSLAGRLHCADGGLLPQQAEACVLGLPPEDEDELARETCRKPMIPSKEVALSGDRHDTFRVGPLTEGSYRLGLRPHGYAQWTWALGTPDGARAAVTQVLGTAAVDLGDIAVLCGPVVEVRPKVSSSDPLPDLRTAKVEAELTQMTREGKTERRKLTVERDRERVVLRELPEGEWTLDLTMSHPFFVPPAPVTLRTKVKLERGRLVRTGVEVAAIGGAVVIEAPTGAARLSGSDGVSRLATANDGSIAIDGVAPDSYHVEMCEDVRCARVVKSWDAVRVPQGQRVTLAQGL
jgi:hypothetical protein